MSIAKEIRAWRARVAVLKLRIAEIDSVLAAPEPWLVGWECKRKALEGEREALRAMIADSPYGDLSVQERSTFESIGEITNRVLAKLKEGE